MTLKPCRSRPPTLITTGSPPGRCIPPSSRSESHFSFKLSLLYKDCRIPFSDGVWCGLRYQRASPPALQTDRLTRFRLYRDTELRANVLKSVLVNFISLLSILIYLPIARDHGYKWLHRVGWAYQILWLLPLLGTSLYLNVRLSVPSHDSLCKAEAVIGRGRGRL